MQQINFQISDMEKAGMLGGALLAVIIPDGATNAYTGYLALVGIFIIKSVFGGTIGLLCTDAYKWGRGKFIRWYKNRK